MKKTYRAMQATKPGILEMVERPTPVPDAGQVLIEVEACGICGADVSDIEGADPTLQPPRVPGHEVVGRIAAIGAGTPSIWKIGQRVGVCRLGGHCNECLQCRRGQFQLCQNQPIVGASCDGGYAEMMLARSSGLISIPDELNAEEAAPILCAGVATFNAEEVWRRGGRHRGRIGHWRPRAHGHPVRASHGFQGRCGGTRR
ncbi:alcohol dehydrogenase [Paraburkholderia diazotrophica]|uniref:Alcohol dehydrogenase n=1 Tax=Paraburkholderia diazotrophica TaxID=667676 RepID=A0A1H7EJM2_9BURK|nr:alcohol dehydrogenase [Paraburkholderia diazotrophica]